MPKIGIITAYPDDDWHSRQIIKSASKRSEVSVVQPDRLFVDTHANGIDVYCGEELLNGFDGFILTRAVSSQGSPDYQVEVYRILASLGCRMMNSIDAAVTAMDKLRCSVIFRQTGLPTPRVITVQTIDKAIHALSNIRDAVIKPIYGSLGENIERLSEPDPNLDLLERIIERDGVVYIQQFIDNPGRDIRAFVIGDRVVASMYRFAPEGEWITNTHAGGRVMPCDLPPQLAELSVRAARAVGLDFTGVDIVEGASGPYLLEVNGAPNWQGITAATGINIASMVVEHLLEMIAQD